MQISDLEGSPDRRAMAVRALLALLACVALVSCGGDRAEPGSEPQPETSPVVVAPDLTPEIVSASLTPDEPGPGELVVLNFETRDPDHGELLEGFLWEWNGRRLAADGPELQVPDKARRGDLIRVQLRVQNDAKVSESVWREVTVRNTPAEWVGLELQPDGEVLPGTELIAVAEVVDHDNDPLEFDYTWKLNGDIQESKSNRFSTTHLTRGDRITVSVEVTDSEVFGSTRVSGPVTIMNSDPRITSRPPELSSDGSLWYEVKASDPDGDRRFIYSLDQGPKSMEIDRLTGVLLWSPTEDEVGVHQVEIRVKDRHRGFALQHFELTVGTSPAEPVPASP